MVRIDRVTTRSGDDGSTRLADGSSVSKASAVVAAIGAVDAANVALGEARLEDQAEALRERAGRLQHDLFDLGADLASPPGGPHEAHIPRIDRDRVLRLERWLDEAGEGLAPLTSFVLPAGSRAAVAWHRARVAVRAAERALVAAADETDGRTLGPMLALLNRLGDWCFHAARRCNDDGRDDVLWEPGAQG